MSYNEYNDMFFKCQDTAPYKMYAYDVINSKLLNDSNLCDNLYKLIDLVRFKIKLIENKINKKILYDGNDLIYDKNALLKNETFNANMLEPMILGDAIAFTVYRDTIPDKMIDDIFEQSKIDLNINYSFHKSSGYYETNNWVEGNEKYFRGYCFQFLTETHKKDLSKNLTKSK